MATLIPNDPLARDRTIRVIGFDDAPFVRRRSSSVSIVGVICAETRFEGMVWGKVRQDGWNATDTMSVTIVKAGVQLSALASLRDIIIRSPT
ncbi:MAG: hypothetical protein N4J56_003538 [Chroococcidiopsis sp. SAG 2025]|nr:DUF99 family protein [Chroococcidiopsis sp. SAG 2025]MDV2993884.1 hypothetical protein [Chroococcidiopsis sp. SAG 2025]